jgi:hypothetical protein
MPEQRSAVDRKSARGQLQELNMNIEAALG